MKKTFAHIVLCLLVVCFVASCNKPTCKPIDCDGLSFKGKVSRIVVTTYHGTETDGDFVVLGTLYKNVYEYDRHGFLLSQTHSDENDQQQSKLVFFYDKHGDLTKMERLGANDELETTFTYAYKFGRGHRINGRETLRDGKQLWRESYEYDKKGNMTAATSYTTGDFIDQRKEIVYDENYRILEEVCQYPESGAVQTTTFIYSEDLLSKKTAELNHKFFWECDYEYDADGNPSSCKMYDESDVVLYSEYEVSFY